MSTNKHSGIFQIAEFFMIDAFKPVGFQTTYLHVVMHNIPETIQVLLMLQYVFCHFNGVGYAKAKSGIRVNFYRHLNCSFTSFRAFCSCSSRLICELSMVIASLALRKGLCWRVESILSRVLMFSRTDSKSASMPLPFNSLKRLSALICSLAVRNIFRSARGKTTVPMSRPSITSD